MPLRYLVKLVPCLTSIVIALWQHIFVKIAIYENIKTRRFEPTILN